MKKFKKLYVEFTNVCNLKCNFFPDTLGKKQFMSTKDFLDIAKKIRPYGDFLYLHVKGEPTLHPELDKILSICDDLSFRVCMTTNGTLLDHIAPILHRHPSIHKLHISLHSFEANDLDLSLENYLLGIINCIKQAKFITVLRLWNDGGDHMLNDLLLNQLKQSFAFLRDDKINEHTYIEHGEKFTWGNTHKPSIYHHGFCYALRNQLAILVDGTVVPCCLDNDGEIELGNIFVHSVEEIYYSPRAQALLHGFSNRQFSEKLCTTCGFVQKF